MRKERFLPEEASRGSRFAECVQCYECELVIQLRFGKRFALRIFDRNGRSNLKLPINRQNRIVPAYAAFVFRIPVIGSFVEKLRRRNTKPCVKPSKSSMIFSAKFHCKCCPSGELLDINTTSERPPHHPYQLALRVTDLIVQSSQHASPRRVIIRQSPPPNQLGKLAPVET